MTNLILRNPEYSKEVTSIKKQKPEQQLHNIQYIYSKIAEKIGSVPRLSCNKTALHYTMRILHRRMFKSNKSSYKWKLR